MSRTIASDGSDLQRGYLAPCVSFDEIDVDATCETEMLCLGDPPPRDGDSLRAAFRTIFSPISFFGERFITAATYAIFYLVMVFFSCLFEKYFLDMIGLGIWMVVSIVSELLGEVWLWGAKLILGLSHGVANVVNSSELLRLFTSLWLILLVLNIKKIPLFVHRKFENLGWPFSYRPVWLSKHVAISAADMHFGRLKVQYRFNDKGLFVVGDGQHQLMSMDLTAIDDVQLEEMRAWTGRFGTPGVKITFRGCAGNPGGNTDLRIHGAHFETNENREERSKDFANRLRALKKLPPIP